MLHLQKKNVNGIKETQDQEESANITCNMCNNTIKITLYCITIRKAAKGIESIINAVDVQGVANN